ncbi:MAG: PEPxxWA-CTERM sorting domain-containing protein [Sphingomicrobium sp.]
MRKIFGSLAFGLALAAAAPASAQIAPAFEYTSSSTLVDNRAFTLGYSFTLSEATTINALGYWASGTLTSHQVAIWDLGGTLLTSGTVTAADTLLGHYRYDSIAPLVLGAGSYVIGGQFTSGDFPTDLSGVTNAANYGWTQDRYAGGGFAFPTSTSGGGYGQNGIAIVNFSVVQNAAVPEPATWAMMLIGFGGIGASLRRRKRVMFAQAA